MILLCNERKRPCIAAPSPNDDRPLESAGWKDSVEAYWPPLTPEHGFPSLSYKVQGAPPQPAAGIPRLLFSHPFLQKAQKTGDTCIGCPLKKYQSPRLPPAALSASGSRVEGLPSSQPVTQAPLVINRILFYSSSRTTSSRSADSAVSTASVSTASLSSSSSASSSASSSVFN